MAEGVNVEPLGSCMIGARAFPDKFRGLVAIAPEARMVTPLGGRATVSPKFIAPSATANLLGRARAIASADVVIFMTFSLSLDSENVGSLFARSIKIAVSAMGATKLLLLSPTR
jgi:hypothetical protein